MSIDRANLPKGLFGYRRAVVQQVLEDREIMVRAAEERVLRAEGRVAELEAELDSVKDQNVRLESQMDLFGAQLDSLAARVDESMEMEGAEPVDAARDEPAVKQPEAIPIQEPVAYKLVAEELTSILIAGQEAAARMIERARDEAQRQIVQANKLLGEVHSGVRQFSSWRADVQPVITRVQSFIEAVRSHIAQTPERVQNALAPLAEVMFTIDGELAVLAGVSQSPFPERTGGQESDSVTIPETDSISVSVDEDHVSVSASDDDEIPLEASAG